jgi:hypothetical protein
VSGITWQSTRTYSRHAVACLWSAGHFYVIRQGQRCERESAAEVNLRELDDHILRFARLPENGALLQQTRSFCTPFRDRLFDQFTLEAVQAELNRRSVSALVLAANPGVKNFLDPKFRSLEDHIASGRYGEVYWNTAGVPGPGWHPSREWRWKAQHYELLRRAGAPADAIAFANYIPWGSGNLKALTGELGKDLMGRVLQFSDESLSRTLGLFRPRLVIAVSSISNAVSTGAVAESRKTARRETLSYPNLRRAFAYDVGTLHMDGVRTHILHVDHPVAWVMDNETRGAIIDALAAEVRPLLQ